MTVAAPDSALAHRANLNISSAIMAKSGPRVPDSLIGRAIDEICASHPVAELAEGGNMPMVVSAVETFLARHLEADRPRNLYSAEAARAAQAPGAQGGGQGLDRADGRPGSSARFRDLPASDSNRRSGGTEAAAASGYASAASLNYVGAANFGGTPFAAAGMNYATFAYVRGQDRALTGQNLLHAVDDAGKLGFGANDKEAIRDHAVIDHYSRDPRHANHALQDYDHRKHEDAELEGLVARAAEEKDATKRAELNARIEERREQHRCESGVQEHIDHDHPKAGAAVRNRANRLDMRDDGNVMLKRLRKHGADNARNSDFNESRAALSGTARDTAAKAEQKQLASSEAKQDTARTEGRRSRWAMADDDAATPTPEKQPSPAAGAAKLAADKPAEPKKAETHLMAGRATPKQGHPQNLPHLHVCASLALLGRA